MNTMNTLKKIFFAGLLLVPIITTTNQASNNDMWVTIFAHGSFSLRPHLNIGNILKMLNDSIEESIYYRSTEINRRDPFFYKNQAMGDLGLQRINLDKPNNTLAAPTVAIAFEQVSQIAGNKPCNQYYTFGWSGLVSNKLRYIEASFLYSELQKLVKELKKQGYNPKIRLLGYSHGGNLGLQLGAIHQTKNKDDQVYIDEFHLLGTPIQVETDYLITSPIFKRIYNWYSDADNVQTLDFFSFKRFFSKKRFSKRKNFNLPDKLTQIKLKVSDYIPKKLAKNLEEIPKNRKDLKRYFKEINYDPGHFELWFMGWTILTYRQKFPTNPLPIMTFIPLITKYINDDPKLSRDLIAYIQPRFETVELTAYKASKHIHSSRRPFVAEEILNEMRKYALQFVPDNYNIETYNRKVYDAINIVQHELKKIEQLTRKERKKNSTKQIVNLHLPENKYEGHLPSKPI